MKNDIYFSIHRILAGFIVLMLLFTAAMPLPAVGEENPAGMAAKVSTEKGALKMRKTSSPKGKVIGEIPNGTCILVTTGKQTCPCLITACCVTATRETTSLP